MNAVDLLIVGAGPAGLSAAIEAAAFGVSCRVIDENPHLGGQIYRPEIAPRDGGAPKADGGDALRERVRRLRDRIEVLTNAGAWAVFDERKVAITRGETSELMDPTILVLATGAHEYVPPFPGWTLPGVMTPGSAQIMTKSMGILPGRRIAISGTGPFLLAAACHLLKHGANIAAVFEASPKGAWLTLPFRCPRTLDILKEGMTYLRTLKRASVPIRYRRMVVLAAGDGAVCSVTHAPVDNDWHPDLARAETLDVDTLCVGYGFTPRVFLAQLAGCELEFRSETGGWVPRRDRNMGTSVENVLAAGDGAGVAGALVASLEGRLAGLIAARRLGAVNDRELAVRRAPIDRELARVSHLRRAFDRISRIRPGLRSLVRDDTLVCRCEEVRHDELRQAVDLGGRNLRTVKVMTRLGMGLCQGRCCWRSASELMAGQLNCDVKSIGPTSPRPPIRPVSLEALAADAEIGE